MTDPPSREPDAAIDGELLRAALAVHRCLELPEQMAELARLASEWTGARGGLALGAGEERGSVTVISRWPQQAAGELPALKTIERAVVRDWLDRGPRIFEGLGPFAAIAEPRAVPDPGACLALPLRPDGSEDWAAVLLLVFDHSPDPAVLVRLERIEAELRPAVANALRVRSMRELVIKDDTAHCFNRRYFESSLPEELARASRFRAALSLIFLDMDNLKEVNKRHGHAMGSRTLLEVSQRIRVKIRRFDRLFRFGGDEFCIVLPETEWHGALEVAERVRDAIASRSFLVSELGESNGVRMTASLGIASYPLHAGTQKDLVEQADRAMQRIKNGTKNSIGIAEIVGESHGR